MPAQYVEDFVGAMPEEVDDLAGSDQSMQPHRWVMID